MKHQIIVIGGGIAGLSACIKLKKHGLDDFLLLEGNDKLIIRSFRKLSNNVLIRIII